MPGSTDAAAWRFAAPLLAARLALRERQLDSGQNRGCARSPLSPCGGVDDRAYNPRGGGRCHARIHPRPAVVRERGARFRHRRAQYRHVAVRPVSARHESLRRRLSTRRLGIPRGDDEAVAETAEAYADDESRALLKAVLAFRVLGPRHVRLPTNTPRYWRNYEEAASWRIAPSQRTLWPFRYRISRESFAVSRSISRAGTSSTRSSSDNIFSIAAACRSRPSRVITRSTQGAALATPRWHSPPRSAPRAESIPLSRCPACATSSPAIWGAIQASRSGSSFATGRCSMSPGIP